MEAYKKAYAQLVGAVDDALTLLDTGDLLRVEEVKEMLSEALLEAEEYVITALESS